jgi:hypothetical protein
MCKKRKRVLSEKPSKTGPKQAFTQSLENRPKTGIYSGSPR